MTDPDQYVARVPIPPLAEDGACSRYCALRVIAGVTFPDTAPLHLLIPDFPLSALDFTYKCAMGWEREELETPLHPHTGCPRYWEPEEPEDTEPEGE